MKFLSLVFVLVSSLTLVESSYAHSDGHPPEKEVKIEVVKENASKGVEMLIKREKLVDSWKKATLLGAEKKKFSGHAEWVVTLENKLIKDEKKQKLYVFLSLSGEFLAANFTGK